MARHTNIASETNALRSANNSAEYKPPLFTTLLNAIDPHLNGASLSSISDSDIQSLAKLAGVKESDLTDVVGAYKLSSSTALPADVLFALNRTRIELNKISIISRSRDKLRRKVELAIKRNIVPATTLVSFDDAVPTLAQLQNHDAPLRTLVKAYSLGTSDSLLKKLEAKKIETLIDLRSAGGVAAVAKILEVPAENPQLQKLIAHAQLSFLGTDIGTNSSLIDRGYTHLSDIADSPDEVFLAKVSSDIGIVTAMQMKRVAGAQRDAIKNYHTEVLTEQTLEVGRILFLPPLVQLTTDPRCSCEECSSAVSPLAYLADLIGYATTKLGTLKADLMPVYRLYDPKTNDHFYTQSAGERDGAASYIYEGIGFYVYTRQDAASTLYPVFRLFHPTYRDHAYTTTERTQLRNAGYVDETNVGLIHGFLAGSRTLIPVYQLLHDPTHDYFYTTDRVERDRAISQIGYRIDGAEIIGYVPAEPYDLLTAHGLEEMFHQPFNDLPTRCEQTNEQVRQVRICIEVLRRFSKVKNLTLSQSFREKEAQYRRDAYRALLLRIGTSYTGLRASRGASLEDRESLAASLGIPAGDGNQRDYLGELLLDIDAVTELDLERLFGLVDTTRDPLSHGGKSEDGSDQVKRWNFTGVSWNVNTDIDGCVFLDLSQSGGKTKAQVYRASGTTSADFLEATAEVNSNETKLALSSNNANGRSNGLAGELEIDYSAADPNIKFQLVPQFVSWRLQTLRKQWSEQDWINDSYSLNATERLPIIDPDLIGPDDFRNPFGATGTSFERFWQARRTWIDELIDAMTERAVEQPTKDAFVRLFEGMGETTYDGTTKPFWPSPAQNRLEQLSTALQDKRDKEEVEANTQELWTRFKLTPPMLFALLTLKKKHELSDYDPPKNAALEQSEWTEVFNLLVQAHKSAWTTEWVEAEEGQNLLLGPREFWISLREPRDGTWPPELLEPNVPRIDPEVVKLDGLPDETAGVQAFALWTARQTELRDFTLRLSGMNRDMAGATTRIRAAFPALDIADLEAQFAKLSSSNEQEVGEATLYVEQTLKWSIEPFKRVMELRGRLRENQNPPPSKPTDAEWAEMERLLTTAYRRYDRRPVWLQQEIDAALKYWQMVKARLPRWRASVEARQAWQQALRARSTPALIDPDLLRETHFRSRRTNRALDLWRTRATQVNAMFTGFHPANKTRAGLEARLDEALGPFATGGLDRLLTDAKQRKVTAARIEQLGIARPALDFLARLHGLLAQTRIQRLTDGEWDDVAAILTQVWKMRETAAWRREEKEAQVVLGPEFFKIPVIASTTQFPPPRRPEPPVWRGTRSDVQDWEDRLQSRLDQDQAVIDGMHQAVSEVEELMMPSLRDALVLECGQGGDLSSRADWITERLLIDAKQGGCEKTTRIAQAIQTVQQLLWGVRTGLLADAYPNVRLLPVRMKEETAMAEFDEAWIWIGSYATWRSAVFVFLYPENIALPSLKRHQTPGFQRLIDDLRLRPNLTPAQAEVIANRYLDYFQDVCSLSLKACTRTTAKVWGEEPTERASDDHRVEFLFGFATRSDRLYWSALDLDAALPDYAQTFWRRLDLREKLIDVIGSVSFQPTGRSFLYLFFQTAKEGESHLFYLRYDRDSGIWDNDPTQIPLKEAPDFVVGLKSTSELEPPVLRIRILKGAEAGRIFLLQFTPLGDVDETRLSQDPLVTSWTNPFPVGGSLAPGVFTRWGDDAQQNVNWFGTITRGGGLAIAKYGNRQNVIVSHAHTEGGGGGAGFIRVGKNLTSSGTVDGWTEVGVYLHQPSGPQFGSFAVAVADLAGTGKQDLIAFYTRTEGGGYTGQYMIFRDLQENVVILPAPTTGPYRLGFGQPFDVPAETVCADAAILKEGSTNYLYVFWTVHAGNHTDGFYRRAALDSNGIRNTSWSDEFALPFKLPPDAPSAGIAIYDLDGDGRMEMVLHYVEDVDIPASSENRGYIYILSSLQANGEFKNSSGPYSIGVGNTSFGAITEGGSVAVADINNNGQPDCLIFHIDSPVEPNNPDNKGFIRIGYDFKRSSFSSVPTCSLPDVKPRLDGLERRINLSDYASLATHTFVSKQAFKMNEKSRRSNIEYLEEALYFVPVQIAFQLQRSGQYRSALDWLRLVYNYALPGAQRLLVGLGPHKTNDKDFQRDSPVRGDEYDWLLDPLNPHSIAQTRKNTYLRFTLLSIIKCMLDYADAEFTIDSIESVPRARELYMTALSLLYQNELKPKSETCEGVRGDLEIVFGDKWADHIPELIPFNFGSSFQSLSLLRDDLVKVFNQFQNTNQLLEKAREVVLKSEPAPTPQLRFGSALSGLNTELINFEEAAMTDRGFAGQLETIESRLNQFNVGRATGPQGDPFPDGINGGGFNGGGFGGVFGSIPSLPGDVLFTIPFGRDGRLGPGPGVSQPTQPVNNPGWLRVSQQRFCVPQNPILSMLRLRANLNLYKIRTCRNISGLKRELEPYAAATDTFTGLPSIGAGGQLVVTGATTIRPTPYRYPVLIERAKQITQLAMQVEQAFLSAIEKSDAEAYALLKANQDLGLAKATVRLQELRAIEAKGGVKLATLQRDRARIQINTYQGWMAEGLTALEEALIALFVVSGVAQATAGIAEAVLQTTTPAGVAAAVATGAARALVATAETAIRVTEIYASQERRRQEWALQSALAEQDFAIGGQQVVLAEDQVRVTEQERAIAQIQNDNAKEVVDFLAGKFTNKELYDWMTGVLESVYSFFLQQATATAQLAQNQLAFERQETPPNFIQPDYWESPSDRTSTDASTSAPDRRGLTGSARLLQDIYQLDQYAFETNKRKLQLTKTVALSHLVPFEFQRFRETGILTFETPMELFDRDFPGHYLRLIKRVRTSVIALIPPIQGIRATLSSTGLSRVVVSGDMFQKINLRRDPETIALSSPINATGLFELEGQQPTDMLLPLEGTGVDSQFEFRMLKASNQFDYSTIADVLVTFEYTALNSFDYYQEVTQSPALNRPLSVDRPYSFRQDFADAWYDLHNPDQTANPMVVQFETRREDFPPNLSNIRIQHVVLYVASTTENRIEIEAVDLRFTELAGGTVGGVSSTNGSVISTRRGNAGPWNAMIGKAPFGRWELRLPDDETVRELFKETPANQQRPADRVADLLLVITYSGRTPEWPT